MPVWGDGFERGLQNGFTRRVIGRRGRGFSADALGRGRFPAASMMPDKSPVFAPWCNWQPTCPWSREFLVRVQAARRQPKEFRVAGQLTETRHAAGCDLDVDTGSSRTEKLETLRQRIWCCRNPARSHPRERRSGALPVHRREERSDFAGCPTLAADDQDAKWYCSTSDGDFHEEHPEFDHTADLSEVAAWIQGVNGRARRPNRSGG